MSMQHPSSPAAFVHLRLHSEYSIVDGMMRIDDAVAAAVADGMPALALTDLSNVFGLVKFYTAARRAGVKPIVGCDVWITHASERDSPRRMVLLCQSREGYLRLADWLTRAYRSNQHRGRAELAPHWFAEGTEGLIALSGFAQGDVGSHLLQGDARAAREAAARWAQLFPDRYYVELQRAGRPHDQALVQASARLAIELRLPAVATHPVQFGSRSDWRAHEARVCIAEGNILADSRRPKRFIAEQYFKTQAEMAELFADLPGALDNAVAIAQRCNLAIPLGRNYLPAFPTPAGVSLDDHLRRESNEGLVRRLEASYPDAAERARRAPEYETRLEFEAKTIIQMGFAGYFLIVADFINWARRNEVPVGPGRGSGAGSVVAYSLGITDLDPLRYGLLFERFLNPERVSMPDFDIDFCQHGRDRVIEYVKQKYGADCVSQIATFGTMAAKAVVRDVGRVLDLPYSFCDGIAKLIPFQPGRTVTLRRRSGEPQANTIYAREAEPLINEREAAEEEVRELLSLAEQLEGLPRNVGMHAGGVLIAPGKLTDYCPLYLQPGSEALISQFDKDDVEMVGLVKFDFLGLTTLTILDWTLRYIRKLDPASTLTLETLPLDDARAYEIFRSGNTTAVFQFESRGMRELLMQAAPRRFEDIIALVALYRPGPMELIPDYVRRKQGTERVEYLDPRLESILGATHGVMVYQEQVMQIAQEIGGYTLGAADLLRRAMGKKKPEEMAKHRSIFVDGAAGRGIPRPKATLLFDLMEKFAGYGFNKSHAAAYALIAFQTAYFKAHHPSAFMAANLSLVMDDTDKVRQFYDDAIALGLTILPPDVNASGYRFEPVDATRIRFGLGAVKGTGQSAIEAIVAARQRDGAFTSLHDFCHRIDKRVVNRRAIEALIRAGAFDAIATHRAALIASLGGALDHAEQMARAASQVSLFGEEAGTDPLPAMTLAASREWSEAERLAHERTSLGFYVSGHPYRSYAAELAPLIHLPLGSLKPSPSVLRIAGIVGQVRAQTSRRGKMAFVTLDDGTDQAEVVVFNETYDAHRHLLREDTLLVAEVKITQRMNEDGQPQALRVVAEALYDLPALRRKFARALKLACNGSSSADRLFEMLAPYRNGRCPIVIQYQNRNAGAELELGEAWRVNLDEHLIASLRDWLKPENVSVLY